MATKVMVLNGDGTTSEVKQAEPKHIKLEKYITRNGRRCDTSDRSMDANTESLTLVGKSDIGKDIIMACFKANYKSDSVYEGDWGNGTTANPDIKCYLLGGEEVKPEKPKPIELVHYLSQDLQFALTTTDVRKWDNIQLIEKDYSGKLDLILCWDNDSPNQKRLYTGHWNGGVVEKLP